MSYHSLPASVAWLQSANHETVQFEHFMQCCKDYREWLLAGGTPEDMVHSWLPGFVEPGDLQVYSNVVSWWPKNAPPSYAPPTLFALMTDIKLQEARHTPTFKGVLEWYVARIKEWIRVQKMSVDNPNETREEREARLNRERVARHRLRHSGEGEDPEENALLLAAKAAQANALEGRKWIKGFERETLAIMKSEIADCKARQAQKVTEALAHLVAAEKASDAAKAALDSYRIKR